MGIKQILLSVVAMCGIVGAGAKPATEVVAHRAGLWGWTACGWRYPVLKYSVQSSLYTD